MPDDMPDWQQRALEAETKLSTLAETLQQTQDALVTTQRRHQIDMELVHAQAVDLEAARLLTEAAIAANPAAEVGGAVADLKKRKPFLFRQRPAPASGMSPAGRPAPTTLDDVAEHARATGDRRALLHYLRAKRGG